MGTAGGFKISIAALAAVMLASATTSAAPPRVRTIQVGGQPTWLDDERFEPDADRNPFLLKLFFGDFADRDALVRQLEQYRAWTAERLRTWEAIDRHIREHADAKDRFPHLTLRFGIVRARATLRWADETLKELRR